MWRVSKKKLAEHTEGELQGSQQTCVERASESQQTRLVGALGCWKSFKNVKKHFELEGEGECCGGSGRWPRVRVVVEETFLREESGFMTKEGTLT